MKSSIFLKLIASAENSAIDEKPLILLANMKMRAFFWSKTEVQNGKNYEMSSIS